MQLFPAPEKGKLTKLTHLEVPHLNLTGEIPSWLANLTQLIHIDLSHNQFTGQIPSNFSPLLERLDLSYNNLEGTIPTNLSCLRNLHSLSLDHNRFVGLVELSLFSSLKNLTSFSISHNNLSLNLTNISSKNLNFPNLQFLGLASCNLSEFPTFLHHNKRPFEHLDLSSNSLRGQIPPWICDLGQNSKTGLYLNLSHNLLTGFQQEHPLFHPRVRIRSLDLRNNKLQGSLPIPPSSSTSTFSTFLVSNYSLSGEVSQLMCNFTSLVHLDLSFNSLSGKLPQCLSHFSNFLSLLDLGGNKFSGNIPSMWKNGCYLRMISMSHNQLQGQIPSDVNLTGETPSWLMNLTQLTFIYLSHTQLSGPIPSWLMTLPQLIYIDLSHNQLTGQIPSNFSHQIEILDLSSNNLNGSIPTNLAHTHNLFQIFLQNNRLVGLVELSLFSHLKNLSSLNLSHNKLSLSFKNISSKKYNCFPSLRSLELASCNFSDFPTFLHNNKNQIDYLDLSNNNLKSQIPPWIFVLGRNSRMGLYLNLSHNLLTGFKREHSVFHPQVEIRALDLRHNMLQGFLPIPPSSSSYLISNNRLSGEVSHLICNLKSLEHLDLSYNNLSGQLPQCLSNFSDSLSLLDLSGNKFDGNIPSTWRNGCNLRMISMSNNQLHGQFPRSLVNCSSLEFIDFGNNRITDSFPSWLGTVTHLSVIILRSNCFHGVINDDIGFSNLRVIDISNNSFSGKLPSMFISVSKPMRALNNTSRMVEYMEQYLDPDSFIGSEEFGSFDYSMTMHNKGLEMNYMKIPNIFCGIDFSSNNFEGHILDAFGDLLGLQLLNISRNLLSGTTAPPISGRARLLVEWGQCKV
ncbi:hypothetical protein DM860_016452 [Cuscuta australis]|uniref:Leucine-rich repeat-containing N-terminal plant-type domain-containing protein n=1 Tax=Cuscuta australis TaxID=267555 RepID=A0A328DFF7_9ASTE|nr:hypothetical protein DM860_016452 [Cuscuta australis]